MNTQQISIDLDRLVSRYGRKLASAEMEAEVHLQRAEAAEARVEELEEALRQAAAEDQS